MPLTNQSKPTTVLVNSTKINIGETWGSIPTTWATETRTWADMVSLIDNISRVFGGLLWSTSVLPWQMTAPWIDAGGISNISKPV